MRVAAWPGRDPAAAPTVPQGPTLDTLPIGDATRAALGEAIGPAEGGVNPAGLPAVSEVGLGAFRQARRACVSRIRCVASERPRPPRRCRFPPYSRSTRSRSRHYWILEGRTRTRFLPRYLRRQSV